MMNLNLTKTDI